MKQSKLFSTDLLLFEKERKNGGVVNIKGEVILPFIFDKIYINYKGTFSVTLEEYDFYLDEKKSCIEDCPSDTLLAKYGLK